MPTKITRDVIRVPEEFLGIVGTPLPTDIDDRISIVREISPRWPWEERKARILRVSGEFFVGAIAAQFGFGIFTLGGANAQTPRGIAFCLDHAVNNGAAAIFGWADNATVTGATTPQNASLKDNREAPFLAQPPFFVANGGTQVAGGTIQNLKPLVAAPATDIHTHPESWGYIMGQTGIPGAAGNTLVFRTSAINTILDISWEGRIILPR